MKVWLDKDEKYPDLIVRTEKDEYMFEAEIPVDLYERYYKALGELTVAEKEIFALWKTQKEAKA